MCQMSDTRGQQEPLSLDEVIAHNVRRLREARSWSVTELAAALGVGRHAVYDYERPRRGRQHAFLWAELVRLCSVLECSLFELVLPKLEIQLDVPTRMLRGRETKVIHGPRETLESGDLEGFRTLPATRTDLSWLLFHLSPEALDKKILADYLHKEVERRRTEALAVAQEVWEQFGGQPDFIFDPANGDDEEPS